MRNSRGEKAGWETSCIFVQNTNKCRYLMLFLSIIIAFCK